MPFTTADVEKHTKKATTDKLKSQWIKVANSWRKNCMARGGSEENCDASAIKSANGVIARQVKEATVWQNVGQIANSAIEVGLALANDSGEITSERADKVLRKWEVELGELWQDGIPLTDFDNTLPDGLQEVTKTVAGKSRPAGDFLVVEDPDKPSTWHLPVKVNGKPDHRLMGGAWAALHGGYRGQKYQGPDKAKAISKLKALYKSEDMETPGTQGEAMFDADKIRDLLTEAVAVTDEAFGLGEVMGSLRDTANRIEDAFHASFSPKDRWEGPYHVRDVFMGHSSLGDSVIVHDRESGQLLAAEYDAGSNPVKFNPRAEWQPVELTYIAKPAGDAMESTGQAVEVARDATEEDTANLSESEVAVIETGRRAPVIVDFQILQPGPGNNRDNRYYPANVVERDIHVFEGVDVFATDHQEKERSERTKVGTVLACPSFFTESRAPVASVLLYDPNQAEKARNRADSDSLGTLECSILGTGQVKDGEVEGKKYKIVEAITQGRYLELVSKAGAGGRALNLAEVESPGGDDMTEEITVAPVEEVEEVEIEEADAGEQEPKMLDGEVVKEALGKTNLPEFVKAALAERQYPSDSELQTAIDETTAEVKKLTGSGLVVNLGATQTVEPKLSLEEAEQHRKDEFNKIMVEVGLQPV